MTGSSFHGSQVGEGPTGAIQQRDVTVAIVPARIRRPSPGASAAGLNFDVGQQPSAGRTGFRQDLKPRFQAFTDRETRIQKSGYRIGRAELQGQGDHSSAALVSALETL